MENLPGEGHRLGDDSPKRWHHDPVLAFLPSPLLGPFLWRPVAEVLSERGWQTIVCALQTPVRSGDEVLAGFLSALPEDRDLVLLPHSNAGAYVPELAVRRPVRATLFVDSVLPSGSGLVRLAPAALLELLRGKADHDGLLPPWTRWWDHAEVAALFPDAQSRLRVEEQQQRLPLSYFEGVRDVPAGWDQRPGGYLAFGDTYAAERDDATQRGWPVRTLPGRHLHQLNAPEQVADTIVTMLAEMGVAGVP